MLPLAVIFVVGVFAQQTFAEAPEAIVGGTPARQGEFPWQASLRVYDQHICGGSIISATEILTAAHCIVAAANDYIVSTGHVTSAGGQMHKVKSIRVHPNYVDSGTQSWVNDVAVITLAAPIQFNANQKAIPLADTAPVPGKWCTLSGWGRTSAKGPGSKYLLKMQQKLITKAECQKEHSSQPIYDSHLCAYNKRGIGACSGDSGGPLVCDGKQYGITSWVLPCAVGAPDAYTSVYHHLAFIQQS